MSLCQKSVFVLTSIESNGPYCTTINSLTSLEVQEDYFLISLTMKKGFRKEKSGSKTDNFSVCLLSSDQVLVAQACAQVGRTSKDFAAFVKLNQELLVPEISGCMFVLKCQVEQIIEFSTNELLICRVQDWRQMDATKRPLSYFDRRYH